MKTKSRLLTRAEGNLLLAKIFPTKFIKLLKIKNLQDFRNNDIKVQKDKVLVIMFKKKGGFFSEGQLFTRKIEDIENYIKSFEGVEGLFFVSFSPRSKDVLYYGSFLYDGGFKVILSKRKSDQIEKKSYGKVFKVHPRDQNMYSQAEWENGRLIFNRNINKFLKNNLEKDLHFFLKKVSGTAHSKMIIPCLFFITKDKKIHYLNMGMR